jgi:hypothetical protein
MPKRKKKAREMTSEELAKSLFHPDVIEHAKKVANPDDKPKPGKKK